MRFPMADYDASRFRRAGRGKIYDSIIDTLGDTPLIRSRRLGPAVNTTLVPRPRAPGGKISTCQRSSSPRLSTREEVT